MNNMSGLILIAIIIFALFLGPLRIVEAAEWVDKAHYRVPVMVRAGATRRYVSVTVTLESSKLVQSGKKFDTSSIRIIEYNQGVPVIQDESLAYPDNLYVPFNLQAEDPPYTVAFNPSKITLTWSSQKGNADFYIYFDVGEGSKDSFELLPALVGNADGLKIKEGPISVGSLARPRVVSWDIDGRMDLIVGNYDGEIEYWKNIESDGLSTFQKLGKLKLSTGQDLKMGWIMGLEVTDWNSDGKDDLLMGSRLNRLQLSTNRSNDDGVPIFVTHSIVSLKNGKQLQLPAVLTGYVEGQSYFNPVMVDWDNDGLNDLLVGGSYGNLFFLKNVGSEMAPQFEEAKRVQEVHRSFLSSMIRDLVVRNGGFDSYIPTVIDWDGNGEYDVIVGDYSGYLYYYSYARRNENGEILLRSEGRLKYNGQDLNLGEHAAPFVTDFDPSDGDKRKTLFLGTREGIVFKLKLVRSNGAGIIESITPLKAINTEINVFQGTPRLMRGKDDKVDLICGAEDGCVYYFKNIGTNEQPLFLEGIPLQDEKGIIQIWEGKAATDLGGSGKKGYSKVIPVDWNGDGIDDLLVPSDIGYVYYFKGIGLNEQGIPTFKAMGRLRDSKGHEIKVHERANGEVVQWNEEGTLDLIVLGWTRTAKDDDFDDNENKYSIGDVDVRRHVRYYRNIGKDKNGDPILAPGVNLTYNGGKEIDIRCGSASWFDWDGDGKKELVISGYDFPSRGSDFGIHILKPIGRQIPPEFQLVDSINPTVYAGSISSFSHVDFTDDGKSGFIYGSESGFIQFVSDDFIKYGIVRGQCGLVKEKIKIN